MAAKKQVGEEKDMEEPTGVVKGQAWAKKGLPGTGKGKATAKDDGSGGHHCGEGTGLSQRTG